MRAENENLKFINPPTMAKATGYTPVVEVMSGRAVYISGQIALDREGNIVGQGDIRAQAQQVFENLHAALAAVGATFENVVKLTIYMTDIAQIATLREVRDQFREPRTTARQHRRRGITTRPPGVPRRDRGRGSATRIRVGNLTPQPPLHADGEGERSTEGYRISRTPRHLQRDTPLHLRVVPRTQTYDLNA